MLAGLTNVTFEFGARTLFHDATWHIQPGERIGLIGYNGTGKSTILKLLAGEYLPSSGSVEKSRSTTIGYLHQDLLSFDTQDSIFEVALSAFERVLKLEKEIEEIGKRLEDSSLHVEDQAGGKKGLAESLLQDYTDRLHELETIGGYTVHHRTEEILQGLGFVNSDLKRPYREFSGGWRMRVLLAKMILQQPDLLLLDEPTNHLDLPSIEWLEKYLLNYPGAVVIVSHDKYFLNRMINRIVELYQQQLHIYSGNFDFYEKEKAIRIDLQQKAYENQQDYIRQNERLVERFRAKASKAAMAQSLIKKLDKLERLEEVQVERPNIKINFRVDKTPGKILVELKNISKSFDQTCILKNASAEINRGDKIALIGANGKGKSTLLRIIAGVETMEGNRKWGHNVEESIYAQHQLEALNINNTVLNELKECGSQMTDMELRGLLGCFLFSGDDVEKKIKILSGGEKARVALAKTIISKANFLLLDEPTNHLDMHSCDLLIESLNRYPGSYILVSHDRFFISRTANKIWEIEEQTIKEFNGGYEEWVEWKKSRERRPELVEGSIVGNTAQSLSKGSARNPKPVEGSKGAAQSPEFVEGPKGQSSPSAKSKESNIQDKSFRNTGKENTVQKQVPTDPKEVGKTESTAVNRNRELKKELQKHQKQFQRLEQEIEALNQQKLDWGNALADPAMYADKQKFLQVDAFYKKAEADLAALSQEYEKVFEKIMELEKASNLMY